MPNTCHAKHWLMSNQSWRRLVSLFLLSIATVMVISACSGAAPPTSVEADNPTSASPTRTVQHALGETQIPIAPERIVLLAPGPALDNLLALEVEPIGIGVFTNRSYDVPPYLAEQVANIASVGDLTRPNAERILELEPDLIIIADFQERMYSRLSQVAPTVAMKMEAQTWKDDFLAIADLVNRTEAAQQLLDQYEQRISEFKIALASQPQEPEVSVVRVRADGIFAYVKSSLVGQILEEAGVKRPPAQDVFLDDGPRFQISLEELEKADGDVMFVYGLEFRDTEAMFSQLQANPLWQQLDAVESDRVHVVPDSYWSFPGIQGLDLLLDDLFSYLINDSV
ncbi:ABC transporter substrate-binding protein [Vacuolonema iberomarrocanum]|uniref:ABC transporter substrate-binding protein n=1 Tax=Vacuolonema iberomarrocanum TaxID=3454632 RepID=UPI001A002654|nr:iron-siderophore ABC transporter substrate-binding protein [filamentous cyanobacterium LEGE 07170]